MCLATVQSEANDAVVVWDTHMLAHALVVPFVWHLTCQVRLDSSEN